MKIDSYELTARIRQIKAIAIQEKLSVSDEKILELAIDSLIPIVRPETYAEVMASRTRLARNSLAKMRRHLNNTSSNPS